MKTVLITGASGGIGEAFARDYATRGANLCLVARSADKLEKLCAELKAQHKIDARFIAVDLSERAAPQALFDETARRGLEVETLINNAGFGALGDFTELDSARQLNMIDLNIRALTELTLLYLPQMRARKSGAIVNVASTAAFQAVPYFAVYSATKAFVLSFSEALWVENRSYNVQVMALCPGVTETGFFDAAAMGKPPGRFTQTPEDVVATAQSGLNSRRAHIVSGLPNKLMIVAERLVPRSWIARIAGGAMRGELNKS